MFLVSGHSLTFYYYSMQVQCSTQPCKSSLWALSVLTVCWETLVLQNPTLMAFYMRLYICSVKALLGGMCVWAFACFHHIAAAVKASLPEAFLIEKAAPLLRSGALWTLRERQWSFRSVAPGWNIMFVYLWREFILLIHWLAPLQRLKEFDFLFIYSLHFSSCGRVVSCVIPWENFLPPRHGPLWNEIRERQGNKR